MLYYPKSLHRQSFILVQHLLSNLSGLLLANTLPSNHDYITRDQFVEGGSRVKRKGDAVKAWESETWRQGVGDRGLPEYQGPVPTAEAHTSAVLSL